jgi:hypothetical protein
MVVGGGSVTGTVAGDVVGLAVVAGGGVVVSAGAVVAGGTSPVTAASWSDPPHAISVVAVAAIPMSVVRMLVTADSSVVPQRPELGGRAHEDHRLVAAAQRSSRCCRSATRLDA